MLFSLIEIPFKTFLSVFIPPFHGKVSCCISYIISTLNLFFFVHRLFASIRDRGCCMCETKLYTIFTLSASSLSYATGHSFYSISYECVNINRDQFHFLFDHIIGCVFFSSFLHSFVGCVAFVGAGQLAKDSVSQLRNGAVVNCLRQCSCHDFQVMDIIIEMQSCSVE